VVAVGLGLALGGPPEPAWGTCVESLAAGDLAACLGAAAGFEVLADKASFKSPIVVKRVGRGNNSHVRRTIWSWETGSVCAQTASFAGRAEQPSRAGGDVVVLGAGKNGKPGAQFKSGHSRGYDGCGIEVAGSIVTGGAAPGGVDERDFCVDGSVDAGGSESCSQALGGRSALSAELAALPASTSLGTLIVQGEAPNGRLEAGPGVHVFSADKILLKTGRVCYGGGGNRGGARRGNGGNGGKSCFRIGAVLEIALDDATTAVVINTAKLKIAKESQIFVDGDPAKVIFNVTGKGSVPIGNLAEVEPAILAPLATIRAGKEAVTSSLLAKAVSLQGASTVPSSGGGGGGGTGLCCQFVDELSGPAGCDDIRPRGEKRCYLHPGYVEYGFACNAETGLCEAVPQCCQLPQCLVLPVPDPGFCNYVGGVWDEATSCCNPLAGCSSEEPALFTCEQVGGALFVGNSCDANTGSCL
jgi:hypothetical protein